MWAGSAPEVGKTGRCLLVHLRRVAPTAVTQAAPMTWQFLEVSVSKACRRC